MRAFVQRPFLLVIFASFLTKQARCRLGEFARHTRSLRVGEIGTGKHLGPVLGEQTRWLLQLVASHATQLHDAALAKSRAAARPRTTPHFGQGPPNHCSCCFSAPLPSFGAAIPGFSDLTRCAHRALSFAVHWTFSAGPYVTPALPLPPTGSNTPQRDLETRGLE